MMSQESHVMGTHNVKVPETTVLIGRPSLCVIEVGTTRECPRASIAFGAALSGAEAFEGEVCPMHSGGDHGLTRGILNVK